MIKISNLHLQTVGIETWNHAIHHLSRDHCEDQSLESDLQYPVPKTLPIPLSRFAFGLRYLLQSEPSQRHDLFEDLVDQQPQLAMKNKSIQHVSRGILPTNDTDFQTALTITIADCLNLENTSILCYLVKGRKYWFEQGKDGRWFSYRWPCSKTTNVCKAASTSR